jgi:hypothetical protein
VSPSRNQLIIDLLPKYFGDDGVARKSGLIFCVSVPHAEQMAHGMRAAGLTCEAVSGADAGSARKVARYQSGEVQFLATCSLLNEGWDSPRTSVIVMARPTMSKVLYTQEIGRGTRKCEGKEARYLPWSNVLHPGESTAQGEELALIALYEEERHLEEIDLFTFEARYPGHLSDEQLARELFVSTDTVRDWVKAGKIEPAVTMPFGRRTLNYYNPDQVQPIRAALGLRVHNAATQYEDFFDF